MLIYIAKAEKISITKDEKKNKTKLRSVWLNKKGRNKVYMSKSAKKSWEKEKN